MRAEIAQIEKVTNNLAKTQSCTQLMKIKKYYNFWEHECVIIYHFFLKSHAVLVIF